MGSGASPLAMTTRSSKNTVARHCRHVAALALPAVFARHEPMDVRPSANIARARSRDTQRPFASTYAGGGSAGRRAGTVWRLSEVLLIKFGVRRT